MPEVPGSPGSPGSLAWAWVLAATGPTVGGLARLALPEFLPISGRAVALLSAATAVAAGLGVGVVTLRDEWSRRGAARGRYAQLTALLVGGAVLLAVAVR